MARTDNMIQTKHKRSSILLFGGLLLLIFSIGVSIAYGATDIELLTVWQSLMYFDPANTSHQVIQEIRLPRGLGSALVGAFLAMSGAIMQGMTRNPLASPSIMGVTDGAAFGIVMVLAFLPMATTLTQTLAAFVGAGLTVIIVFAIGSASKTGLTPVKLALAGVAIGTLVQSLSSIFALHFQLEKQLSFWIAGGLANTTWNAVYILFIAGIIGVVLALTISKSLTILSLGEDIATGLGQNNTLIKIVAIIAVFMLTGAAVTTAGAVGFLGLIIPHITRFLIGNDYRWIIPISGVLGGILLVNADIVARMINAPFETPVGAITSIIGVPFFLYLARGKGVAKA